MADDDKKERDYSALIVTALGVAILATFVVLPVNNVARWLSVLLGFPAVIAVFLLPWALREDFRVSERNEANKEAFDASKRLGIRLHAEYIDNFRFALIVLGIATVVALVGSGLGQAVRFW